MANLHHMVINNVGKMICRQLVGTLEQHLVIEYVTHNAHITPDKVIHMNYHSRLNLESHHILITLGNKSLHLLLRKGKRIAHLHTCMGIILEILYLATLCLQLFGRVEGDVCLAAFKQLVNILLVYVAAFALSVWAVVSAERHTLVKLDA